MNNNNVVVENRARTHFLACFRWYRKWRGGHWELWDYNNGIQHHQVWYRILDAKRGESHKPDNFHNTTVIKIEDYD